MKYKLTDSFEISTEVLSQEVNGETVLLDLQGESYFGLNDVGTRIWQLLQAKVTLAEALDTLTDEYDVGRKQLEGDLGELLGKLMEAGLIEVRA